MSKLRMPHVHSSNPAGYLPVGPSSFASTRSLMMQANRYARVSLIVCMCMSVCARVCEHVLSVTQCCCVRYRSSFAGGVWDTYADKGYPLWQLQITHEVQRSIVFQLRDSLGDFLRSANGDNPSMPATIQELEKQLGVRLIVHTLYLHASPKNAAIAPRGPCVYMCGIALSTPRYQIVRTVVWRRVHKWREIG